MNILIVEDDTAIADFISRGLEQQGYHCSVCSNGTAGLDEATGGNWDCIIADVMLPGMSGIDMLKALRGQGHGVPVIILSARTELDNRLEGFQAGADDYLTKPFSFAELLARIQALMKRAGSAGDAGPNGVSSGAALRCGNIELDTGRHRVMVGGVEIELPKREFSLLEYLLRNQGMVLSKSMILEKIWGYHFDPQTNVVDVLVHRLRGKVDPGHQYIHTVRGTGYVCKEHN